VQSRLSVFWAELKRRKVYRVAVVYVVVGSGIIGLGDAALPAWDRLQVPVVVLILIGLPIALVLAWAYEIRPAEPGPTETTSEASSYVPSAGASALPTPADDSRSIVVLPFENLSPDPDNAFFSDGLTDEVIADLSKIGALRVISRTSAMMYKDVKKGAPAIAAELNVRYVLEGSVRKAGQDLRITAQLIDGTSDTHLWAEKYSGTVEDTFDLQEQLSRRIVEALKGALTPEEGRRLAARTTDDPRVYELWMRARQLAFDLTGPGIKEAIRLTEEGLERYGEHALLHAAIGVFHYLLYDFVRSDDETLARCTAAATRALELNSDLPEAWFAMGFSEYKRGNTPVTVRHLRKVLELEQNSDALWWLAFLLSEAGLTTEARRYAQEAVDRDPLTPMAVLSQGTADLFSGRFDTPIRLLRDQASRSTIDPVFVHWWLGQALAYGGAESEAVATFEKGADLGDSNFADFCELGARAFRGDREGARTWFESNANLQQAVMRDETFPRFVAQCFARLGEFDDALRWLDRASEWGFTNHEFLAEHDRFLVPLRQDPRFLSLLERLREKQRAFEA
jgi:TolB-like protein